MRIYRCVQWEWIKRPELILLVQTWKGRFWLFFRFIWRNSIRFRQSETWYHLSAAGLLGILIPQCVTNIFCLLVCFSCSHQMKTVWVWMCPWVTSQRKKDLVTTTPVNTSALRRVIHIQLTRSKVKSPGSEFILVFILSLLRSHYYQTVTSKDKLHERQRPCTRTVKSWCFLTSCCNQSVN